MRRFAFKNPPTFKGHLGRISALAFSPNGSLLASGGENDLTICIWRVSDGVLLHMIKLSELAWFDFVTRISFSPDGDILYGVSDTGLQAFSVNTGERIWHRKPRGNTGFGLSPNGRHTTVTDQTKGESRLRLLDLQTNRFLKVKFPTGIYPEQFSPDGTLFRTGWITSETEDGFYEVFSVSTGERIMTIPGDGSQSLLDIKGRNVLARLIADPEQKPCMETIDLTDGTRQTCAWQPLSDDSMMVPETTRLVSIDMFHPCRISDLEDAAFHRIIPKGPGYDTEVATRSDGTLFAIGDSLGMIRFVETSNWTVLSTISGGARPIERMAVSADSRYMAMATKASQCFLWDIEGLELRGTMVPIRYGRLWRGQDHDGNPLFFDDGIRWLGRPESNEYQRYERATQISWLPSDDSLIPIVQWGEPYSDRISSGVRALSQNARWLGYANSVKAWLFDLMKGEIVAEVSFPLRMREIYAAAISESGRRMVVGDLGERFYIDFANGRVTRARDYDEPSSAAIHPDDSTTAEGTHYMETFHVRNPKRRKSKEITGHVQPIRALAYTPDGRTLLSAAADGQIILWDAETLERKATLMVLSPIDHPGPNWEWIAYTPTGEFNSSPGAERWFVESRRIFAKEG